MAWRCGNPVAAAPIGRDSIAEPVADEHHWPELRAIIAVVSDAQKDTSSTAGMGTSVATSLLLAHRAAVIVPERVQQLEAAYLARDFQTFGRLTMQDSNQFHAVCLDTYPPIFYLNDTSRDIIRILTAYNAYQGEICAAYTFDAGPNAVIYCREQHEQHAVEIGALLFHYFPPSLDNNHGDDASLFYVDNAHTSPRNAAFAADLRAYTLPAALVAAGNATGRRIVTDVQKLYYTRPGPGPQPVTDVCNLDPDTGLNIYQPSSAPSVQLSNK